MGCLSRCHWPLAALSLHACESESISIGVPGRVVHCIISGASGRRSRGEGQGLQSRACCKVYLTFSDFAQAFMVTEVIDS